MNFFLSGNQNPPCNRHVLHGFSISMTSSSVEAMVASLFAKKFWVWETASWRLMEELEREIYPLIPALSPVLHCREREGEECVRTALENLGCEIAAEAEPACDADDESKEAFVDVVGDGWRDEGTESEGFTSTDALISATLVSKNFLEGFVHTIEMPLCYSSLLILISFSFVGIIKGPSIFSTS